MSIVINTGKVTVPVEIDGSNGVYISFNPHDVLFMEKLHRFYRRTMEKADEWDQALPEKQKAIASVELDERGVPIKVEPMTDPVKEMNSFMRKEIDEIFGEGKSAEIFGDAVYENPEIYIELVDGIKPYMERVRDQKINKYIAPPPSRAERAKKTPRKRTTKKNKK